MKSSYFFMPGKVYFENEGIEKYLCEIKNYGKKVLIVSGKNFIFNNIDFLIESLKSEDKSIKTKAERCVKENPYKIDFEKIL